MKNFSLLLIGAVIGVLCTIVYNGSVLRDVLKLNLEIQLNEFEELAIEAYNEEVPSTGVWAIKKYLVKIDDDQYEIYNNRSRGLKKIMMYLRLYKLANEMNDLTNRDEYFGKLELLSMEFNDITINDQNDIGFYLEKFKIN